MWVLSRPFSGEETSQGQARAQELARDSGAISHSP